MYRLKNFGRIGIEINRMLYITVICLEVLCIFVKSQQVNPPVEKLESNQESPNSAAVNNERLMSFDACKEDVHRLCNKEGVDLKSDLSIIECLQDAGQTESATLTRQCEDLVWQFKLKLTQDERFTNAAKEYCKDEIAKIPAMAKCVGLTQPGYALSCFFDFIQNVTTTSACHAFLQRTERLAFSDFRLIGPFVDKCGPTLSNLGCGTLTPHNAHKGVRVPHTQGMALECLISKVVKNSKKDADPLQLLDAACRHEVMRLVEMQTDDFHLDRPLFFACRQDRERFCKDVPAGQGKIFECLMMSRNNQFMEPECASILAERAYIMGRNYRMAHPLVKSCSREMNEYKCEPQSQLEAAADFHLAWILLCLENAAHNAKDTNPPSLPCQHEMLKHRQMMVSEFHMSPELVMRCSDEIDKWCSPKGDIEAEGRTLHCLMGHASAVEKSLQLGSQCMQAVKEVVKVADIGSNYKVDKVLYGSCRTLIDGVCAHDANSEASTLTCLMRHIDSSDMNPICEKRLLEVQYFMARDWSLDPQLYSACHDEAVRRCHANENWHVRNNAAAAGPDPGPAVLACLYRSAYDEAEPLSHKCGVEVRRVLHTRAVRVNLIPDIEDACRDALSEYCSHNVKPMEQFASEDIDHGSVMECLLNNKDKPEMTSKCRSYVNHFELVSLRDYHFSYKFQKACAFDIEKHCRDHGNDKGEIIRCLSEVRFEHKVLGTSADLSEPCKRQLKVAYLQQEQVEFDDKEHMADADPTFSEKCAREIHDFKCDQAESFEDTVECLRINFDGLGPECKSMVFYREKIEAADNTMDDELQKKCKYDIQKFCPGQNGEHVLDCLTNTKIVRLLQQECKAVVKERMREASRDIRLRPTLLLACKTEAEAHCAEEVKKVKMPQYAQKVLAGVVVSCLREKYRESSHSRVELGPQCKLEIAKAIVEAEFDVQLDPPLYHACENTIKIHCSTTIIKQSGQFQNVLECLKADFYKGAISDKDCGKELARRLEETMVDIHLDPSLHEACSVDIKRHCSDVIPGHSRVIMCLMDTVDRASDQMTPDCRNKLTDRNKLWMKAHAEFQMAMPENWQEVYTFVANHPHKVSILGWLAGIVFFILLVGCCCGRASKQAYRELKNK
ncbi:cysteine rich repeat-containing domain protein [Dictyocaulus viviparus]|uniref:Cysteine rich repeat-containing domain protein n=1 Tax=Dictyocaulus viviparus TaxID=29172 RepID=A0A0D8Y9S4_DICVI|nr:cysteine rich repeat-containing domain protein [Dictyocaulus viviparus]